MTTLETLKAARKVIEDPAHWTQEEFARQFNDSDELVWAHPHKAGAVCWCATGAIACVQGRGNPSWNFEFDEAFGKTDDQLQEFNDSHTHADVLAAFDEAIKKLETA